MIVDTHTHLYLPEFDSDGGGRAAVERALAAGVGQMIFPNVDCSTIAPMKALHSEFPDSTSMAMGLHPTEIGEDWSDRLDQVEAELRGGERYVAVGEIGMDLYWDKTFEREQMLAFERQMKWAQELDLPVIIHCRDAQPQLLEVLQGFRSSRGVMHSFGGAPEDVDSIRKVVDYYFGINGIVTFKNSKLRETLPAIGPERLLVETDSPYLAPVPHRGRRNESAYIINTVGHIAESLGRNVEAISDETTQNARDLFAI